MVPCTKTAFDRSPMKTPMSLQDTTTSDESAPKGRVRDTLKVCCRLGISVEPLLCTSRKSSLVQNLGIEIDRTNVVPYRYANAFEIVYTDLQKMGVATQLAAAFKNGGRLQFKASYTSFNFDDTTADTLLYQQTAFNLPQLSLQFNGTLKLGQRVLSSVVPQAYWGTKKCLSRQFFRARFAQCSCPFRGSSSLYATRCQSSIPT